MQLKEIDINLHLKAPGFLLKIRARLLDRERCESENTSGVKNTGIGLHHEKMARKLRRMLGETAIVISHFEI